MPDFFDAGTAADNYFVVGGVIHKAQLMAEEGVTTAVLVTLNTYQGVTIPLVFSLEAVGDLVTHLTQVLESTMGTEAGTAGDQQPDC